MKRARHQRPRRGRAWPEARKARRRLQFEPLETRRMLDAAPFVIGEVLVNPHGVDGGQEYIEIRATSGVATTIPAGTYLLSIEGDTFISNPGDVQNVFDLSGLTTGVNGILVLAQKGNSYSAAPDATKLTNTGSGVGWGNGSTSSLGHTADGVMTDIENTSMTLMLVSAPAPPTLATDIDSNNDGTPDGAIYSSWTIFDSVGLLDGVDNDFGYGAINFRFGVHGSSQGNIVETTFNPGYVARKGQATGATVDDWIAGYVSGTANNWSLSNTQVSDPSYAGQPLNHIGSANPNTNPSLAQTAGTFDEGGSRALTGADLQATDPEQSSVALQFAVSSLPIHGVLRKDSAPLAVGDMFTQADVNAGRISYAHDGSETSSDGFDYTVVDGAGGSATGDFAITITPVNDLPSLAANLGLALDEDALSTITASLLQTVDVDNTAEQLTYAVIVAPAHGTLAKNGVALVDNDTFTQHDIDLGLVTYQHNGDLASADAFTFTLSDGSGGAIGATTFGIAITQYNLPPTIAANETTVSVSEGTLATVSGTYADADGELRIFTASVGTVVDHGDGTWTWSYVPANGPDSQLVTVTIDDGLATAQATFTLETSNAAPSITINSTEVTVNEGVSATNSGTFADVAADPVILSASIGNVIDNGNGTWSWSYTPANGPQDPQNVTITADDGLAQSQVTFTLNVANAPPALTVNAAEITVIEGKTATNSGTVADVAADTVTLSASVGTVTTNGDGTWTWSFATADGPEETQIVSITADDGLATSQVSFALTVNNAAPTIAANASEVTVIAGETATNTGTFADVAADTVTLAASIGVVIDSGNGTWTWNYATTSAALDTGPVTITATDSDNLLSTVVFHLTVNPPASGGAGSLTTHDAAESSFTADDVAAIDDAFALLGSRLV